MAAAARASANPGNLRSPIANGGFPLAGPSERPDPTTHAYRQDLADVALAGRVVASHYAEPLIRHVSAAAPFLSEGADDSALVERLVAGDELRILDISRGWAWGYGPSGAVGYVRSDALIA